MEQRPFKILIILSFISYIASIWAFIYLEGKTLLEAVYFVVVTLSTVGFGDIIPTHPITKLIVIILITIGLSTLAFITSAFAEQIVRRTHTSYTLPSNLGELDNHVLIFGINPVSTYIAIFLQDRFYKTVLLGFEEEEVIQARREGFESYLLLDIVLDDLKVLKVENSAVIYTFTEEQNSTIKLVLSIRELNEHVPIYSRTSHEISIVLGELIGITRTYHNERLIGSFINFLSKRSRFFYVPNQIVPNARYFLVVDAEKSGISKYCQNYFPIAKVGSNLADVSIDLNDDKLPQTLYAIPQSEITLDSIEKIDERRDSYRKLFIGGFSHEIHHIINHITIENREVDILTFKEDEYNLAVELGYPSVLLREPNILDTLERELTDRDLVINMFSSTAESLNLTLNIRKSKVSPIIYQYVRSYIENDIFKRIRVNKLFSPRSLTARAMVLIFLDKVKLSPSFITENHHLFEHYVKTSDPLIGKPIKYLLEQGYHILLYSNGDSVLKNIQKNRIISQGDTFILYKRIDL